MKALVITQLQPDNIQGISQKYPDTWLKPNSKLNFKHYNVVRDDHENMSCKDYDGLLAQITSPFILGGGFSAHHTAWGSTKTDNSGNIFIKTIDNHNLMFLNDGSPTKITRPNQACSAIDVTLSSTNVAPKMCWRVLEDSYCSHNV